MFGELVVEQQEHHKRCDDQCEDAPLPSEIVDVVPGGHSPREHALSTELMASAALHGLSAFVTSATGLKGDERERALNNLSEQISAYIQYHLGERWFDVPVQRGLVRE